MADSEIKGLVFAPHEDITAYELAVLWANIVNPTEKPLAGQLIWITPEIWEGLPDNIKRHFK